MTKKSRITLRIADDEIAVVGSRAHWEHLVETYEALAGWYPDEAESWNEMAEWIRGALKKRTVHAE